MKNKRVDITGSANPLTNNPFEGLDATGFKPAEAASSVSNQPIAPAPSGRKEPNRNRGRVDVVRQTAGRGGKTVTVLTGFKGIAMSELEEIARAIRKASGVGGTVKPGAIEIQGDQREKAEEVLRRVGFRPVRAGG